MNIIEEKFKIIEEIKPALIESFVEVYGEKHRARITSKINSCIVCFFEDNYNNWNINYQILELEFLLRNILMEKFDLNTGESSERLREIATKCANNDSTSAELKAIMEGIIETLSYYELLEEKKVNSTDKMLFLGCSSKSDSETLELQSILKNLDTDSWAVSFLGINKPVIAFKTPNILRADVIIHELNHILSNDEILEIELNDGSMTSIYQEGVRPEDKDGHIIYTDSLGNMAYEIINEYITIEVVNAFKRRNKTDDLDLQIFSSDYMIVEEILDYPIRKILEFYKMNKLVKESLITSSGQKIAKVFGKDFSGISNFTLLNTLFEKVLADYEKFFIFFSERNKDLLEKEFSGLYHGGKADMMKLLTKYYKTSERSKAFTDIANKIIEAILDSYLEYLDYEEQIQIFTNNIK